MSLMMILFPQTFFLLDWLCWLLESLFMTECGLTFCWLILNLLWCSICLDVRAFSIPIHCFWNLKPSSFINSSGTCGGAFKNANSFDFPVFLSIGISTLQFWCRYSIDLSPNNSFISSSVTFGFKFPTYNFLQFCFSCWLDWYFCFWICWSTSWRFFWWCLFCWCCWQLSLVGWASSVRCNSGLSCVLVCCFANLIGVN